MRRAWEALWMLGTMAIGSAGCTSGPPAPVDTQSYVQHVQSLREAKDQAFRDLRNADSPIPLADRASFPGLVYYPIDPAYHVPAALAENRTGAPRVIELPSTNGPPRQEREIGKLSFLLQGTTYTLTAFMDADEGPTRLFVPFKDLTNGTDTYGGGRFLDLDRTATGLYDLDFNRAYDPYCAYNPTEDCPVPPAENRLPVAIRAGERLKP